MNRSASHQRAHSWEFSGIGTTWLIDVEGGVCQVERDAIGSLVERFDATWSRFREDSLVTAIAAGPGTWQLPDEAEALFELYRRLAELTDGAVTPLIGRTLADLGYDASYSLRPLPAPSATPPADVLRWEPPQLSTTAPVLLDIGAAGKGLLVDLVAEHLRDFDAYTVDASGDLLHRGADPLRIALEHPMNPQQAIGVAELPSGYAMCASAANRRAWGDGLHHVIDARTNRPADNVVATWVIAPTCMLADGCATAAFFVPPLELERECDVVAARLLANGRLQWTENFPGEIFT